MFPEIATRMSDQLITILMPMGWEFDRRFVKGPGTSAMTMEIVLRFHVRLNPHPHHGNVFQKLIVLDERDCYYRDEKYVERMPLNWAKEVLCDLAASLSQPIADVPFISLVSRRRSQTIDTSH